ncbi:uncharacterized protein LOC134712741 isoform X1 [Mytilus trossulus]|uniref:uncharacterized protein LOC134712741 isoform X1 n=1 Tax=Mytilus trossulus TaxID=6551 RepID=UPI00300643C8
MSQRICSFCGIKVVDHRGPTGIRCPKNISYDFSFDTRNQGQGADAMSLENLSSTPDKSENGALETMAGNVPKTPKQSLDETLSALEQENEKLLEEIKLRELVEKNKTLKKKLKQTDFNVKQKQDQTNKIDLKSLRKDEDLKQKITEKQKGLVSKLFISDDSDSDTESEETRSDEWLSLRRKARTVLKAAFRPGTFKNLRTQLNTYLLFCEKFCRSAFPVDQETLCGYVCFLSDNFKNSGSVRNYLSGVKTWAILLNFDTEEFNSPSLRLTLSGIDKLNTNIPNIKLPFEPYHLNRMFEVLDMTSVQDAVMWAVIMISFYAMLRKSQFANNSRTTFNPKEQLTRGDIQITEEGLIIDIQWSKTSQKHKNIHQIPLKRVEDCTLCPVLAYSRMVTMLPALPGEPAFGLSDSKGKICAFSKSDIDKILHKLLVRCGIDTSQYSFHSLRRGGATCASAAGCSDSEICTIGNWTSSCYKGYIKHSTDKLYYISSKMGLFCKLSN